MNPKIKDVLLLLFALFAVGLAWKFYKNAQPLPVQVPVLDIAMVQKEAKQEEKQQDIQRQYQKKEKQRQMFSCKEEDDCIIVDKDLCGCLSGPQGVVAINASYTFEFNKTIEKQTTKTCSDGDPSMEKECSPSARAVCERQFCKIIY